MVVVVVVARVMVLVGHQGTAERQVMSCAGLALNQLMVLDYLLGVVGCGRCSRRRRGLGRHIVHQRPGHVIELKVVMILAQQIHINRPIASILECLREWIELDLQFSHLDRRIMH